MNRSEIVELFFIAPIVNIPSILTHGILSHKNVRRINHHSVAMPEIQTRRKDKQIPGAGKLHDYVNLYFDAHNPMLSKLRARNDSICVLRVEAKILDLQGVIITDRNAASDWACFSPVGTGLNKIDKDRVFAQYWTHPENQYDEWQHKSEKCAEILVPDCVPSDYLIGAYVANETAKQMFLQITRDLPVEIKNDIFF